jgi:xanthine dehydrogenase accessory factor
VSLENVKEWHLMLVSDDDILRKAQEWQAGGAKIAIATVIETWGSAPCPVGSHLVIDSDGRFIGSVSGGCIEAEVVNEALDVIAAGNRRLLEFGVLDEIAWRAGLSCGGNIKVYVERVDLTRGELLAALNAERTGRRPALLITDLTSGAQRLVRADDVARDPLGEALKQQLQLGKSGTLQAPGGTMFVSVQLPPVRLVIVGAGHIAQALAPMAMFAGFDVVIIDPRTAFATPERFPDCQVIADWPEDVLPQLALDQNTATVALSHEPRIDDPGVALALAARCFYVGALGSRKTHAKRLERLQAAGMADATLATIHAPIGLDIAAVSPAEIAIAILAEIVATRRQKPLRSEQAA